MIERESQLDANGHRLSGTFCAPADASVFPVVLMIHGSGPLDRDENMKGQRLDVFNTIAHRLAQRGVASLRCDKRGCGASTGDYASAGQSDLLADAIAWVDRLAPRAGRCVAMNGRRSCLTCTTSVHPEAHCASATLADKASSTSNARGWTPTEARAREAFPLRTAAPRERPPAPDLSVPAGQPLELEQHEYRVQVVRHAVEDLV